MAKAKDLYQLDDCLPFFGFLRLSEFTIPSDSQFDKALHLCLNNISIDNRDNPKLLQIRLKQSKTDPFRRGVSIYLGATESNLCPAKGILPYLALRGTHYSFTQMEEALLDNDSKQHWIISLWISTWTKGIITLTVFA